MKTIFKILIPLLVVNSMALAAGRGGSGDPGGGVLIQQDGQLKTLAEAGIFFEKIDQLTPVQAYPEYYFISKETRTELKNILEKVLPIKNMGLFEKILENRTVFIKQPDIGSDEYEVIKNDYAQVIKSFNLNLDPSSIILSAYSNDGKTYFLPNFDKLNARRQSLILIHEYFMRTKIQFKVGDRLAKTLEFDSLLYKILNNDNSNIAKFNLVKALVSFKEIDDHSVFISYLLAAEELNKKPLLVSDFSSIIPEVRSFSQVKINLDPSLLQRFNLFIPGSTEVVKNFKLLEFTVPLGSFTDMALNKACADGRESLEDSSEANDILLHVDQQKNWIVGLTCEYTVAGAHAKSRFVIFASKNYP